MPYIQNALSFTIETIVGLYLIAVILRFLFQLCRVDFRNPISQMIVMLTNPPLQFLRRFIPGLYGIDLASVVLILAVATIKVILLLMVSGFPVRISGALVLGIGESLNIIIWTFLIAILISAILSWVAPRAAHPAVRIINDLCEPVLRPFRRILPGMGGIDFSPLLALLVLNLAVKLVVYPIMDVGKQLLLG